MRFRSPSNNEDEVEDFEGLNEMILGRDILGRAICVSYGVDVSTTGPVLHVVYLQVYPLSAIAKRSIYVEVCGRVRQTILETTQEASHPPV